VILSSAHLSARAFALVRWSCFRSPLAGHVSSSSFSRFEITRDYNSVLPLMLVCVIASGVAMLLMPKFIPL